jgi:hypothetical protein
MIVNEVLDRICKVPEHIWRKYEKPQPVSFWHFTNRSQTFFLSIAAILAHLWKQVNDIIEHRDTEPELQATKYFPSGKSGVKYITSNNENYIRFRKTRF